MTIREILEKVDLFNVTVQDSKDKHLSKSGDGKTIIETTNPSSAFLGPKLWDKQISLDLGLDLDSSPESCESYIPAERNRASSSTSSSDDISSKVMNMEEFLAENGLTLSMDSAIEGLQLNSPESSIDVQPVQVTTNVEVREEKPVITRPNVIMNVPKAEPRRETSLIVRKRALDTESDPDEPAAVKSSNDFLYAESKRARLEREKEEKRRKFELELEFAPEDLALATVPGAQFDPTTRAFDVEELRPQPIIRKRKRIYVPEDSKDDRYWNNRIKNNVAARRSREARRLKENQIALRAAFLEKENRILKQEVEEVKFENDKLAQEREILKMKLAQYESN